MPYSFTQIEQRKSYVIQTVFVALFILYFLFGLILYSGAQLAWYGLRAITLERLLFKFDPAIIFPNAKELLGIAAVALLFSLAHWYYVSQNLITRVIGALRAEILNPDDAYHRTFQNIIEELQVATGGRYFTPLVIPTMAMNACAAADFEGRTIICLTEGLLAKLNRAQIEAVVAHEAGHILQGDSLETTLTISLFNLMNEFLKHYPERIFKFSFYSVRAGFASFFLVGVTILVYILLSVTHFASLVLNMFMSRQREFRADAIAVRLTRDPLALAEALYIISNNWRGAGLPGESLAPLFIVNHRANRLDEGDSLTADLFSTHPPISQRLSILLDMAYADIATLEAALAKCAHKPRTIIPALNPMPEDKWLFHREGKWVGPFGLAQLTGIDRIAPNMLVKKMGGKDVKLALDDPALRKVIQSLQTDRKLKTDDYLCPRCHVPLLAREYESTVVYQCPSCQGYLITEENVARIIVREEVGFSEDIIRMARKMQETNKKVDHVMDAGYEGRLYAADGLMCPHCRHKKARMFRRFFSTMYHVVIDKCVFCGRVWFDKDELEILQFLIEEGRAGYAATRKDNV